MKKIEVLLWGIKHIAGNYNMGADVNYEDNGQVCIYVTPEHPDCSPAPINDVQMLCMDLGIKLCLVDVSPYGVDVWLDYAWVHTEAECKKFDCPTDEAGMLLSEYTPNGHEMWKKSNVEIGS